MKGQEGVSLRDTGLTHTAGNRGPVKSEGFFFFYTRDPVTDSRGERENESG